MSMTVAVTRNLPARFGGFLASCMLQIAPGVYAAPDLRAGVRQRVWKVMIEWARLIPDDGGVVLIWRDTDAPSGLSVRWLGYPKADFVEHEGLWLVAGSLTEKYDLDELKKLAETPDDPPVNE